MGNRPTNTSQNETTTADESRLPPSGRLPKAGRTEEGGGPAHHEEGEEVEVELPPPMRPISSLPPSEETNKVIK